MTAPATPQPARQAFTVARLVMAAAAASFLVAALTVAFTWSAPASAWFYGGFAGVALSWFLDGVIIG